MRPTGLSNVIDNAIDTMVIDGNKNLTRRIRTSSILMRNQ